MQNNELITQLDTILLSDNVCDNFNHYYKENQKFREWLDNTLPEVKMCSEQQQNNPWHIYNCLDHILHSVEEMNKQTLNLINKDRRLLAYTMFYHDMGKPKCHIERIKDGKKIDSFFNHNIESANIVKRTAKYFDFTDKEIEIIAKLVYKHDIFMFIKPFDIPKDHQLHWRKLDDDLIKTEIKELDTVGDGYVLFDYLLKVGKSDSLAQNPKMTVDSLKLIDTMVEMFTRLKSHTNSL